MLLIGSILPAGAGGAQLWQLAGAAPANIELNTTAGAAGILAEMPADNKFKISLTDTNPDIPFPAAAMYHFDSINTIVSYFAVIDRGGTIQPQIEKRDFSSNNSAGLTILGVQRVEMATDSNFGNAVITSQNSNLIELNINNISGYVGGRLLLNTTELILETYSNPANAKQIDLTMNTKFNFRDGVGNNLLALTNTGQIETNQTAASVAVRAKVAEMPIYDTAGVLVGYININL